MESNYRIIGGMGVIENDFHDRKDLAPNVCAVYTEEDRRCNGIAGALLNYAYSQNRLFMNIFGFVLIILMKISPEE